MSGNTATPFVYGNVLLRDVYEPQSLEPSRVGRCLSQGAATGAVIAFLFCLIVAVLSGNPYLVLGLPFLLVIGIFLGLFQGLVVWAWMKLAEHHLSWGYRVAIGVSTATMIVLLWFFIWMPRLTDYLIPLAVYVSCIALSVTAGSKLQPWRELVRGAEALPQQLRLLTGITGLTLRVVVVFFLMESILATILTSQFDPHKEHAFALIVLSHCLGAFAILFARFKFWLLLPSALLVNIPTVLWLREVAKDAYADVFLWYFVLGYLALWAVFLFSRWSGTYSALATLKEELRYYLID